MNLIEAMKADAKICNRRARKVWGINSHVRGQQGITRDSSQRVIARREEVFKMAQSGMSYSEICEATGLTRSTVKSDIYTCRAESQKDLFPAL